MTCGRVITVHATEIAWTGDRKRVNGKESPRRVGVSDFGDGSPKYPLGTVIPEARNKPTCENQETRA